MKVYLVFQASGDYEDYRRELKGVLSTKEKAQELKNDLDSGCVFHQEDLDTIMPEEVFDDWPYAGDDGDDRAEEYKGYTLEDYTKYDDARWMIWMNFRPCDIEVWEVDGEQK